MNEKLEAEFKDFFAKSEKNRHDIYILFDYLTGAGWKEDRAIKHLKKIVADHILDQIRNLY